MNKVLLVVTSLCMLLFILGCGKSTSYGHAEAIERGDVVRFNEVENLEKFIEFLKSFENKEEDTIRITSYTDEGDPIYQDLKYDGEVIHYRYDNSHDQWGGDDKGVKNVTCTEIAKEEPKKGHFYYFIRGCSEDVDHLLIQANEIDLKNSN